MATSVAAPFGTFDVAHVALDVLDDLASPVAGALTDWGAQEAARAVLYVDTDPAKADTAVFAEAYAVPLDASANCVVVAAKHGGDTTLAACLVLAGARVDVNNSVRKHLGSRKASFAPMEVAVTESRMEYGGITPIGLPSSWPLLIDAAVVDTPFVLIGSGRRRGKLIVPGWALAQLPGVEVLQGLAL